MRDWPDALADLDRLQLAAQALAVLGAAERSGLLDLLATGTTAADAASELGLAPGRAEAVLQVLRATGVAVDSAHQWRLDPGWEALLRGDTPFEVGPLLETARVRAEQLGRSFGDVEDYWRLTPHDRLSVARGVSFDPLAPSAQAMVRQAVATLPGAAEALERGGAVLELGCGVASRLTAVLLAFPAATGVGLELDADLAAWGRGRAERAGLATRLDLVVADATAWQPDRAFDLVQWSQFFFPQSTRQGALAVAWQALRPGGWVNAPAVWDGAAPEPGSSSDLDIALERLVLEGWGVPLRTTEELGEELEAAGFVDVQVLPTPQVHYVRARRP